MIKNEGFNILLSRAPGKLEELWLCTLSTHYVDKNGINFLELKSLHNIELANLNNLKRIELSKDKKLLR